MDKKAKSILFKTYWSSQGWKREYETDPVDFEYAKSKGLMFDPISLSMKEVKSSLKSLLNRIEKEKITNGFLSSLSNKRLDWRSALASYFNAKLILEGKREFYRAEIFKYENEDLNVSFGPRLVIAAKPTKLANPRCPSFSIKTFTHLIQCF